MNNSELKLFSDAARDKKRLAETIEPYVKLRKMSAECSPDTEKFRKLFATYYALNVARPSRQWQDAYFRLLFTYKHKMPHEPYRIAFLKLYKHKIQGDKALQFSFVSKLVSFNDERQPLFDQFIQGYFGLGPPSLRISNDFRISGFLQNLGEIRRRYEAWLNHEPFKKIVRHVRREFPDLKDCHPVRICDFLVWSVGKRYQTTNKRIKQSS